MVGGEGLQVYDAYQQRSRRVWFDVLGLIEDTRGIKNPTGCKNVPNTHTRIEIEWGQRGREGER